MATTITRYVNPDSSGGDGTTQNTSGTDAAYASLSAALTAEATARAGLVARDEQLTIICESNGTADTTGVLINAFTTDATRYLEIKAGSGHAAGPSWSASKYRLAPTADATVLDIRDDYVRIEGLQMHFAGTPTAARSVVNIQSLATGANEIRMSGCLINLGGYDGLLNVMGIYINDADTVFYCWNTIIYNPTTNNSTTNCAVWVASASTCAFYNCTFHGNRRTIRSDVGTTTCKNTYASQINGNAFYQGGGTLATSYCSANDATADDYGATGAVNSVAKDADTFVNVTAGSEDFHLAADGLSPLQGTGEAPGGSAPLNYTTDMDGDTISDWSIGADGIAAATAQYARPASVVGAGNWDGFISGVDQNDAANLDNYIDEDTADDDDSIRSGTSPSNDTATIGLSTIQTPAAGTVTMRIRARFL